MEPVIRIITADRPSDFDSALAATAPLAAPDIPAMPLELVFVILDAPADGRAYLDTPIPMPCSARYEPVQVDRWNRSPVLVIAADQHENERFLLHVPAGTVNRYTATPVPSGWYPAEYAFVDDTEQDEE